MDQSNLILINKILTAKYVNNIEKTLMWLCEMKKLSRTNN